MNILLFLYQDDENHDPQWSDEQIICHELVVGGVKIGRMEVEIMHKTTACIFEVLEKAWSSLNCSLIDMKVEYGVTQKGICFFLNCNLKYFCISFVTEKKTTMRKMLPVKNQSI